MNFTMPLSQPPGFWIQASSSSSSTSSLYAFDDEEDQSNGAFSCIDLTPGPPSMTHGISFSPFTCPASFNLRAAWSNYQYAFLSAVDALPPIESQLSEVRQSELIDLVDESSSSSSFSSARVTREKQKSLADQFEPTSSVAMAGARHASRELFRWLQVWAGKRLSQKKKKKKAPARRRGGRGRGSSDDDDDDDDDLASSDQDNDDDASLLSMNVAVVQGVSGSGKTSLVHTCARELGFNVIEINAAQLRCGSAIKKLFAEASQSHGLSTETSSRQQGTGGDVATFTAKELNLFLFDEVKLF